MNTYPTKGPGRKQCPSCKIFIGVRRIDCICGYRFNNCLSKKTKKDMRNKEKENVNENI